MGDFYGQCKNKTNFSSRQPSSWLLLVFQRAHCLDCRHCRFGWRFHSSFLAFSFSFYLPLSLSLFLHLVFIHSYLLFFLPFPFSLNSLLCIHRHTDTHTHTHTHNVYPSICIPAHVSSVWSLGSLRGSDDERLLSSVCLWHP